MAKSILKRITKYNADRSPELVKYKYQALAENPFRFFRGTCHLFYEDLPRKSFIFQSPKTWVCGDLHLENFGSFKGSNRLAYFDMNDFDESFLGPCLLDVLRLCTSIFLSAPLVKMSKEDCRKLVGVFLNSYAANLTAGYIRTLEQETARGFVRDFLNKTALRKRSDLLKKRVEFSKKNASLRYYNLTSLQSSNESKKDVKKAIEQWAAKHAANPGFYKVLDISNRANGTGSIGVQRHLVLVNGKGGPDGFYLLDVKEAVPASALDYLHLKQPEWSNEAERIIAIEKRVQSASPAFLNAITIGKKWFVMRELQPMDDKIDFTLIESDLHKYTQLLTDMGAIVAWNNLRSGGRQGSAIADDLIKFGNKLPKLEKQIVDYAEKYAGVTEGYWREYCKEYKR